MKATGARLLASKTIWLGLIAILLCTAATTPKLVQTQADLYLDHGWVVVATQEVVTVEGAGNQNFDAIYTINTYTNEKYGPFLMDELTALSTDDPPVPLGRKVMDVAITPDGKTALISSSTQKLIHFVDLSDPAQPVYLSAVKIDIDAVDIDITAGGHYAIVAGPEGTESVFSIDIDNRKVAYQLILPAFDHDEEGTRITGTANAVEIAPNGTGILADYENGVIHTIQVGDAGRMTYCSASRYYINYDGETSLTPFDPPTGPGNSATYRSSMGITPNIPRPINVAIAPDGQTVLVPDARTYVDTTLDQYTALYDVGVYRITGACQVEFIGAITQLTHAIQTISIDPSSEKVYMMGNSRYSYDSTADPTNTYANDGLFVMNILGPGNVVFNEDESVDLQRQTTGQFPGVDGLAVYDGSVYASYPSLTIDGVTYPERYVSAIDLTTHALTQVDWGLTGVVDPVGLAVRPFTPHQTLLPFVIN